MTEKRKIEVFSAGCAACSEVIEMVRHAAGPSDEVTVHEMKDVNVARCGHSALLRALYDLLGCCHSLAAAHFLHINALLI
jgi:glutaredoxin 3